MGWWSQKIRKSVVESGIAGDITVHTQASNRLAIAQMQQLNPTLTLGIEIVERAMSAGRFSTPELYNIVSNSLGVTSARFMSDGAGRIDPSLTMRQLELAFAEIDRVIASGQEIVLATGHPGSLLDFYSALEAYIRSSGGRLFALTGNRLVTKHHWMDTIGATLVLSDSGALPHTHDPRPITPVLKRHKGSLGLVIADHGFAGAAINLGIPTIAIHDVDDPAIPVAVHLGAPIVPIPMNDNRLNLRTGHIMREIIAARAIENN